MSANLFIKNVVKSQFKTCWRAMWRDITTTTTTTTIPVECETIIYGNDLTAQSIAYHLSLNKTTANQCIVMTGESSQSAQQRNNASKINGVNSALINHFIVGNARLSLLIKYTSELYETNNCGAIYLATNDDRVKCFKRIISASKILSNGGKNCDTIELLSPQELKRRFSYIDLESVKCGIYVAIDGVIDDIDKQRTRLRKSAETAGIRYFDDCLLNRVYVNNNKVSGIQIVNSNNETKQINCKYFVNAVNNEWSRRLGKRCVTHVKIPTLFCEHQIMQTKPFLGIVEDNSQTETIPIIQDFDAKLSIYQRHDQSICITGYEKVENVVQKKLANEENKGKLAYEKLYLQQNWDRFHHILNPALKRVPILSSAKFSNLHNYPENFSPDGRALIGEVAEVENYLLAASVEPQYSGGAGKLISQLINKNNNDDETATFSCHDFWSVDPRRFTPMHSSRAFLLDRLREIPAKVRYGMNYPTPHHDYETGHGLRVSPIYPRVQNNGAVFVQIMGYERPAVYINADHNYKDSQNTKHRSLITPSFGRPHWLSAVQHEYQACRERVAILDYCSFTKVELKSENNEVVKFLQYLCSNDIDVNIGHIVHTGMQNENGGYENDVSLIRLEENSFMLIGPTEQKSRCMSWLNRHNTDSKVHITDISDNYTALCVMGPLSKSVLSEILSDPEELDVFPFFTYKELEIGMASRVRVCNLTHTGELGWVLYVPNEYGIYVYDQLLRAGNKYGIKHAGSIAMRTLRIEKFFAFWGQDLDATTTPLECGRAFRVKFDKQFLGREALLKQKERGVRRRYVQLVLEDFDSDNEIWPFGGEPIYICNEKYRDIPVGLITTTGYGFTLSRHVCLGFIRHPENEIVTNDYILKSKFEIEIGLKRYKARTNIHSPKLSDVSGSYLATR